METIQLNEIQELTAAGIARVNNEFTDKILTHIREKAELGLDYYTIYATYVKQPRITTLKTILTDLTQKGYVVTLLGYIWNNTPNEKLQELDLSTFTKKDGLFYIQENLYSSITISWE